MKRRNLFVALGAVAVVAGFLVLQLPEKSVSPVAAPAADSTQTVPSARPSATTAAPVTAADTPTNALFLTATYHWQQPIAEEVFASFHDWAERYLAASPTERAALLGEGVALAETRRTALKSLIQTDPECALELAVPHAVRKSLPPEVTALLEERVSGRGRLAVLAALPEPGRESEVVPVFRKAELGDRELDAFVYGRRLGEPTRANLPLSGIAVDDFFAVYENPLRVLEPDEAAALLALAADPICTISSLPATVNEQPIVADAGGQKYFFCAPQHALEENDRLVAAEGGGPSGDSEDPQASPWTEGQKKLILIRVDFSDLVGDPFSTTVGTDRLNSLNSLYSEMSYGITSFAPPGGGSEVTPTFRMPQPGEYYGTNNYYNQLRTDARNAAAAAGYALANYNLDVICMGAVKGFTWGGLGYVGAAGSWVRTSALGTMAHELGHNFGLHHASYWDTAGQSIIGPGTSVEYGDSFDLMGTSSGLGHFSARYKHYLNYLRTNEVLTATTNGTYRIYAHDNPNSYGIRGLRIVRNSTTNYWVEFRQKLTGNKWMLSGAGLRWAGNGNQRSQLLDTTPGSTDGKTDSPLVIGRTFSDKLFNIHITPIRKGGTSPESLDVVVNLGAFPGNQSPVLDLVASATNAGTGTTLTFQALATDPNGDALAYYWSFGDGNFGTNGPVAAKSWTSTGEYVMRCEVSDMKGGVASKSIIVVIGSPTTYRIAGQVLTTNGPLQGARVSVSTTRMAWTDSDGTYTITGLPAGNYTVTPSLYPYAFIASGFTNPVRVGPNASDINFAATETVLYPPTITTQPLSQTVSAGANVTFNVSASGTTPLYYQWRFNGANIVGATGGSYTKSNVQSTDGGNYSVVVSNLAGTATSANALLTVSAPPVITSQPQSQTIIAGNTATFSVSATGSGLAYQWRHQGTNIPGATASAFSRSNAQLVHGGNYTVVITNALGAVTSAPAALTIHYTLTANATPGGSVTKSPNQASYAPASVVTLTATSESSFPFGHWSGDATGSDNPLLVAMTTNLTITANFTSPEPDLIVDNPQAVLTGNWSTSTSPADKYGDNYAETSGAQSTPNATATYTPHIVTGGRYDVYIWHPTITRGAASVPVTISSSEGVTNLTVNQTAASGGWLRLVADRLFAAGTNGFLLLANNVNQGGRNVAADAVRWAYSPNQDAVAPQFTTHPTNVTTVAGGGADFTASATGSAPLTYQWLFAGDPLPGATNAALLITNVQAGQAGSYCVVAANAVGSATSAVATLTVLLPPEILETPQPVRVTEGGPVSFSVLAAGSAPLAYQWRFNQQPLTNATAATWSWSNALPAQAGLYDVLVSNPVGVVTSAPASLVISVRPLLGSLGWLPNGRPQFALSGTAGDHYAVEASTNLFQWLNTATVTNETGTVWFADPETNTGSLKLYRARLLP